MQTRRQLSRSFTLAGETMLDEALSSLAGEHVAFVFDAYTLHHRHEIAGLLVTPQLGRDPLLVYLVEASNEQNSYAEAGRYCEMLVRFFVVTKVSILNFYFLGNIN
jgi:putative Mn2+ efflux pump MntP